MNPLTRVLDGESLAVPPVWLMRQAGRYQKSYRALRRRHAFDALCRQPELAARVALDAVRQFDFDAAILFSDLLFPLEAMGFGLSYADGPPTLDRRLTPAVLARLRPAAEALPRLAFQRDGVAATRQALDRDRALIGFIGGPWTLYVYAVEGTHAGALTGPKGRPGLYTRFARRLMPLLRGMIREQVSAGADLVMIFDTAAGELAPAEFDALTATDLAGLARVAPGRVGYYARGVQAAHLASASFAAAPWAGVGIDWRWSMADALAGARGPGFVQGNFDPALLHREGRDLNQAIARFVGPIRRLPRTARRGWVCGLGHGVLPGTPEASVRRFVGRVREEMAR